MHILFLSHYFPPEVNAPATRTYEHCKRWVSGGNIVTVITCAPNCPNGVVYNGYSNKLFFKEIIDGITTLRVWTYLAPNKGFLKRIINYVSYMISAAINGLLIKNVDCIIATSPQFFCGWAGVLLHVFKRKPFILEIRDIWPESIVTVGAMRKSRIIRFLEFLEIKMYNAADHIITVGEGYKKQIVKKHIAPEKISVIINGVDLNRFSPIDPSPAIRKKFNADGKLICSYIGTVGMAHGLEVVLDAAKLCTKRNINDILFLIVGDGARREYLEASADQNNLNQIIFTGRLPKDEMPGIIASSDCSLVHLRGTELFGTVIPSKIFELMAMNIPIIIGVRGEAQDIVLQGKAGVPMKPDDPESLLECIHEIRTTNPNKFMGREFVAMNYNRDTLAHTMLEIIQKNV